MRLFRRRPRQDVDPLTGAFARRMLESPGALRLPHDERGTCTFVYFDIVGVRAVNATFGNEAGDAVLKSVASAWLRTLPAGGSLVRVGGDEFVAVLPGADIAAAEAHDRAAAALTAHPWRSGYTAWSGSRDLGEYLADAYADLRRRNASAAGD